ncbi:hypothetical protein HELRODRAFT_177780 [Helobdella robusta]|uniref:Uncharacterized protein n=1 Tax=Helobdella robusta TaxID=6412 RepID=T1FC90_HELRO|nr:hypothetical protein HELRODRAFT_177780 [Helobdella robusta]ESN97720.1 hypothetical protein HELRODRAFT_177780 [Helobdella robusta]
MCKYCFVSKNIFISAYNKNTVHPKTLDFMLQHIACCKGPTHDPALTIQFRPNFRIDIRISICQLNINWRFFLYSIPKKCYCTNRVELFMQAQLRKCDNDPKNYSLLYDG